MASRGNIGELIQMIASLGQLKNDRRRLDLSETQLKEQAAQFASEQGRNDFTRAIELLAKADAGAREGLLSLETTLRPEYREAFRSFATGQPVAMQTQRERAMQEGMAGMDPATAQRVQQEAAATGLSGMNLGQVGGSQVAQQVAGSTIEQGLVPDMARIGAGVQMDAAQQASANVAARNAAVAERGVAVQEEQQRVWADMQGVEKVIKLREEQASGQVGGLTPAQSTEVVGELRQLATMMVNPELTPDVRRYIASAINRLAASAGMPEMMVKVEGDNTTLDPRSSIGRFFMEGMPKGFPSGVTPPANPQQYQHMPTSPFSSQHSTEPTTLPWMR